MISLMRPAAGGESHKRDSFSGNTFAAAERRICMAFWIFMTVMDLLIPLTMIGMGNHFRKHPPKEINWWYGYRTGMSMKNEDTWRFAHDYCGRLWTRIGWLLLPVSAAVMMPVLGKSEDAVGTWGGILCMIQVVILMVSIFPTEIALRKNFDEHGRNRKRQ